MDRHAPCPPAWAQRMLLSSVTAVSRRRLPDRSTPLPAPGGASHLTSVLRVPAALVPGISLGAQHHHYPPRTVHITVANLDRGTAPIDVAIARLAASPLVAPTLRLDGVGCSPDTVFLRCLHDRAFVELRARVRRAFRVPAPRGVARLYSWVTFANVVRFDGPGRWPGHVAAVGGFVPTELEIVRTDRFLSDDGTEVLARVPLTAL